MPGLPTHTPSVPAKQLEIRRRSYHPKGGIIPFAHSEINRGFPARFEKVVRAVPDRPAVRDMERQFTFRQLNNYANQVALELYPHEEHDNPVALLFDLDAWLAVGQMSTLKAGRFYVRLHPSYPVDYLLYLLSDSGAKQILTDRKNYLLATKLGERFGCDIEVVDTVKSGLDVPNLALSLNGDSPACIVYTSGTTGHPKGVLHSHCNELKVAWNRSSRYGLSCYDREGVLDGVYPTTRLLYGTLAILVDVEHYGLPAIASLFCEQEISVLIGQVSTVRELVRSLPPSTSLDRLRFAVVGGESVTRSDVALFRSHFPPECILCNVYGVSEVGLASEYAVEEPPHTYHDNLAIGFPTDDQEIWLVNETGQQVGYGEIGEMWVRSPYLAQGYWRHPELTHMRFLSDPEGGNRRIYCTGDLAYRTADGYLFHLGRKDLQVKIRGYRVEIPSVEAALLEIGGVNAAVVTAQSVRTGTHLRLVAFLEVNKRSALTPSNLRSALARQLPNHMIPSVFQFVDALPRTYTGKIDRSSLPSLSTARPELAVDYVTPGTPIEQKLAEIWSNVLDVRAVGLYDPFLELGGDSLLATQILARVIRTFPVDLPLQALLASPTIGDMAMIVVKHLVDAVAPADLERLLEELESKADSYFLGESAE